MNIDLLGTFDGLMKYGHMSGTTGEVNEMVRRYYLDKGMKKFQENTADYIIEEMLNKIHMELVEHKKSYTPFEYGAYWYVIRLYILKRLNEGSVKIKNAVNKVIETDSSFEFLTKRYYFSKRFYAIAQNVITALTYRSILETIPFAFARAKGKMMGPILEKQIKYMDGNVYTPYGFVYCGKYIEQYFTFPESYLDKREREDIISFPIWDGNKDGTFYKTWLELKSKYSSEEDYEFIIGEWEDK